MDVALGNHAVKWRIDFQIRFQFGDRFERSFCRRAAALEHLNLRPGCFERPLRTPALATGNHERHRAHRGTQAKRPATSHCNSDHSQSPARQLPMLYSRFSGVAVNDRVWADAHK
jgi:hypothetical protein